jgi:hypothetical protein
LVVVLVLVSKSKIKEKREKRSGITPAIELFFRQLFFVREKIPQLTVNVRNAIAININD